MKRREKGQRERFSIRPGRVIAMMLARSIEAEKERTEKKRQILTRLPLKSFG